MSADPPKRTSARAPAPEPAPTVRPVAAVVSPGLQRRAEPRVSQRSDPAEREAEATAKRVMRMAAPAVATVARRAMHLARFADAVGLIQRRGGRGEPELAREATGAGGPAAPSGFAASVANQRGGGSPLSGEVRGFMETRFGADFSRVRVHTGDPAARLTSQVSAHAFTYGGDVFFGRDRFRPDTSDGRELIAHELTHTIQQGGATQDRPPPVARSEAPAPAVGERSGPEVQRLGLGDALDFFARQANNIPGFRMFTIVIGVNPINMSAVDRSAANILRAVVEFIPGGGLIVQALDTYGVFDRAGAWIEQQLASLGISGASIKRAIDAFLASLSWTDIFDLGGVWNRARAILGEPVGRIIAFVRGLGGAILDMIKDAILRPLAALAARTPAWDLLCAVLGRNPITGDPVPRTADTLIGGFMKLIGQEEIWENLKRANAVSRAFAWFQGALSGLLGFVQQIPGLFLQAFRSLQISDVLQLPTALGRVARVFGDFFGRFAAWAGDTIWNLLEIIFSVVAPGVLVYLQRARAAFRQILQNPIGFVGNLVRAGVQGLRQFAARFLTHLRASLIGWLTGALGGAGIYIPQGLSLREIIRFVLSVLGVTWQNVRQKLVRAVGEPTVRVLETTFDIVTALVTQGPAAAWERIQEAISNLREMVLEQIMTFVRDRVVQAAITRLVTSLNPAGAFIQAVIATYNTIMFFVERLRQIAQVAASIIDSLAAIASGAIGAAANRVEQTLAGLLTLAISFLARIAGLGRVSDAVINVVNRVRAPIDRALDRLVDWIVATARRLGRLAMDTVRGGGAPAQDPQTRLRGAVEAAEALMQAPGATTASVRQGLAAIRARFGLTALELRNPAGHQWNVVAKINPELPSSTKKIPAPEERAAIDAQSARIAQLWRLNGVGPRFRTATPAQRRAILLDGTSYARPGNVANAPEIRLGDLVEAAAEPGLRQIAAATGGTLLVQPSLYLADAAGQPLGGRIDEIDFLLLGPAEVRLVSAKLQRGQFARPVDARKLALFQNVPDNPAAAPYIANALGWDERARAGDRARTAGVVVVCANLPALRVSAFRARYLNRERTRNIVIEPVAPHGQGETPTSSGYSLRITLADLIDIYVDTIARVL